MHKGSLYPYNLMDFHGAWTKVCWVRVHMWWIRIYPKLRYSESSLILGTIIPKLDDSDVSLIRKKMEFVNPKVFEFIKSENKICLSEKKNGVRSG